MTGPFLNQKKAAEYCGYSPSTFCKKLQGFQLPMAGPDQKRYAQSVLDEWMTTPEVFRPQKRRTKHKPVKVTV
ncbi:DNA-binding protein [Maridesulfovibrio sp.]|uniref:DNA-binding protein n=1 Tax=Maridesulfovibrio sp. TaxID=2795000 RepID=UPI0029CA86D4|nr:DNA-binding protein [Maridesulfovibrio sp.]